jgi:hypothetical protein
MLQFALTDLQLDEGTFEIPSVLGKWVFERLPNYNHILASLEKGMVGNTYSATNSAVNLATAPADFAIICSEIIDICLVLSFINGRCVTPSRTTANSDIGFVQFGDAFIRPRAIRGFSKLQTPLLTSLFSTWLTKYHAYQQRGLRLQLSHWLSGLTCFSLEDLFLSVGVQMDIIKQQERRATGSALTYFQGMTSASSRFGLSPLGSDYKNMRNDIVHEGVLSGTNFYSKSKAECARVIADTLDWLDRYVLSVIGVSGQIANLPRWDGILLAISLPTISAI